MKALFKILCLLSCLAIAPILTTAATAPRFTIAENCNLPAPATIVLSGATTQSLTWDWTPVAGASGYAYTVFQGNTLITSGTTAATNITAPGLLPSTGYTIQVAAICPDGTTSCNSILGTGCTLGIIIDVVSFNIGPPTGDILIAAAGQIRSGNLAIPAGTCGGVLVCRVLDKTGIAIDTFALRIPTLNCCEPLKINGNVTLQSNGFIVPIPNVTTVQFNDLRLTKNSLTFQYSSNGYRLEFHNVE